MARVSISEASRLTGKSRTTLHRLIKAGDLSTCSGERNAKMVDTSELLRVFGKTINSAQQEIRLMGYSFTSPEVAGALVRAKQRGLDVKVVLDWKANTGRQNKASLAAMNLLVNAGIPVRTVSQYKIMHDKVIIADGRNVEVGSFNYTRAADRVNSENVLVVWDVPVVAQHYLRHWQSRWNGGTDWYSSY
ncbi:phospholipase D-like domain-containing protein [Klebsiella quasipneumoniae]